MQHAQQQQKNIKIMKYNASHPAPISAAALLLAIIEMMGLGTPAAQNKSIPF